MQRADLQDLRRGVPMAALLYGLDVLIAPVSFALDPSKLIGAGLAGAAMRVASAEATIRLNMLCEAVYQTVEIFLALLLYRMFKPVGETLALQMIVLALLPIPIMFLNLLPEAGALFLAHGSDGPGAFDAAQRDALVGLMIRLHGLGVGIAGVFWGLWLLPLGLLIIRSAAIPKLIGLCEVAGCLGWLLASGAMLVMPGLVPPRTVAICDRIAEWLQVGELPFIVWLLASTAKERFQAYRHRPKLAQHGL